MTNWYQRLQRPRWIIALSAMAIAILATPQLRAQPEPVLAPPVAYSTNCAMCHGPNGEGSRGPRIVGGGLRYGSDYDALTRSIKDGYPTATMPGFGNVLSDAQVDEIVTYLMSTQAEQTPQASFITPDQFFLPREAELPQDTITSAVESFRTEMVTRVENPYGMAFLPDGRLLVTEAIPGRLRIIENGKLLPDPVEGTPIGPPLNDFFRRQLLDVAVHPTNGWIYLTSAEGIESEGQTKGATITLSRGHISQNKWVDVETLLRFSSLESAGARIVFDQQGLVYIGTIQVQTEVEPELSTPQDLSSPHGKILRLMPDGSVPPDNPFLDQQGAYPYVWAYGIRSPLGLTFDDQGRLWESENGPRGGDELNLIKAGKNYGWPVITWGHPYTETPTVSRPQRNGMEQPVVSWVPSPATSGAAFYRGEAFPNWNGSVFVTSLKQETLYRVTFDGDRMNLLENMLVGIDRLRDIEISPEGYLYIITDGGDMFRVVPD